MSFGLRKNRTLPSQTNISEVNGRTNSTSESTTRTASSPDAATAVSLITRCRIQPRTGGNGRPRFIVMLLNGTGMKVRGKKSARIGYAYVDRQAHRITGGRTEAQRCGARSCLESSRADG